MIDPGLVFNGIQVSAADGGFRARWQVPDDLPYFNGHFPGMPIFPAVGIVDATLHALRIHLKSPSLQITGIPIAKFLIPVVPNHKVNLEFKSLAPNEWQCEWKDENGQKMTVLSLTCAHA